MALVIPLWRVLRANRPRKAARPVTLRKNIPIPPQISALPLKRPPLNPALPAPARDNKVVREGLMTDGSNPRRRPANRTAAVRFVQSGDWVLTPFRLNEFFSTSDLIVSKTRSRTQNEPDLGPVKCSTLPAPGT